MNQKIESKMADDLSINIEDVAKLVFKEYFVSIKTNTLDKTIAHLTISCPINKYDVIALEQNNCHLLGVYPSSGSERTLEIGVVAKKPTEPKWYESIDNLTSLGYQLKDEDPEFDVIYFMEKPWKWNAEWTYYQEHKTLEGFGDEI